MIQPHIKLTASIPDNEIPVLLTIFNRPDKTKAVIDNLRKIKPKVFFVSADGPRQHVSEDAEKCHLARQELTNIDWECDVKTRFHDDNKGCDPAVSSAIDWLFGNVEFGVILEDDCLVSDQFFSFCGKLLAKYRDDERIMQISSTSPYAPRELAYDYHFSRTFRCGGGWATWRRAWKFFTSDMHRYSDEEALEALKSYYPNIAKCMQIYRQFLEFKSGRFVNWDFQWNMACYFQNGLSIVPEKNLMKNIGFDVCGTHTKQANPIFGDLMVQQLSFPLRHPPFVYADSRPEISLDVKIYRNLRMRSRCMYLLRQVIVIVRYIREVLP